MGIMSQVIRVAIAGASGYVNSSAQIIAEIRRVLKGELFLVDSL